MDKSLYIGCDCNYDLCKTQRGGNYHKWRWFDRCLYWAIAMLSLVESGSFDVFSGLGGVKLDAKAISEGYFVTYTSTSWSKQVAKTFMESDKGIIVQIDQAFKVVSNCCDVSWISKFPDECEILFSRSTHSVDGFKCTVVDDSSGGQTVIVKKVAF